MPNSVTELNCYLTRSPVLFGSSWFLSVLPGSSRFLRSSAESSLWIPDQVGGSSQFLNLPKSLTPGDLFEYPRFCSLNSLIRTHAFVSRHSFDRLEPRSIFLSFFQQLTQGLGPKVLNKKLQKFATNHLLKSLAKWSRYKVQGKARKCIVIIF